MSAHTTAGGGGVSTGAFGGGAAVANRPWWTSDGSNFLTGENLRFDGTNLSVGGALVSGRRLALYLESSGVGMQVLGFANNQDSNILIQTPDSRLLIPRIYGGTTAGTINGVTAAALAILEASNSSGLLLGATDARSWVRQGASMSLALGGTAKTFPTAVGNVGGGTDVLQTFQFSAGAISRNGARIPFGGSYEMAANGATKTPSIQFGGQNIWTPTGTAMNGGAVFFSGWIERIDATNAEACVMAFVSGGTTPITVGLLSRVEIAVTFANALSLEFLFAGTNDNDGTARGWVDTAEAGN